MDPIHEEALKKCQRRIVRDLILQAELWDLLVQYDIFTPMMLKYIDVEKTPFEKNRKLLDDLKRRGPEAYGKFLKCLHESKQGHIANEIEEHERVIRRQRDPYYSEPTPATSGTEEEQILYSVPLSQHQSVYDIEYSKDSENVYKMDTMPRGYALIINNKDFRRMNCRLGTDVDCQNLQDLFQYLGFEVIVKHNLTGYGMILEMNGFAHEQNLRNVDSIAVAILSHGHKNETIYGVDSVYIKSLDVFNIFASQNCHAMDNKPKMVIINACRGGDDDFSSSLPINEPDSVNLYLTSEDQEFQPTNAINADLRALKQQRNYGLLTMQDFLVSYSTFPGHVSLRNIEHGSWFIQSLCEVFKNDAHKHSVLDMMTKVNRKVASFQDDGSLCRQIPELLTSMIKRWLLNPPLYQSNSNA